MLPFDFDDEEGGPDYDKFDDTVYGSISQFEGVYEAMHDMWHPNEGGFESDQILDMIYQIDNYEEWEDEDGNMHYSFDYEWESEDGSYSGSGHIST